MLTLNKYTQKFTMQKKRKKRKWNKTTYNKNKITIKSIVIICYNIYFDFLYTFAFVSILHARCLGPARSPLPCPPI